MKIFMVIGIASANFVDRPAEWPTLNGEEIQVIGHRGIKSIMPEHTLGGYWLAGIEGADYVEPDLMLTKDEVVVCYHDMYIRDGTNVEEFPKFKSRKRNFTGIVDGKLTTIENQYFISDFTLDELQELQCVQKNVGVRPQYFNNLFHIPTLEEFLMEMHRLAVKVGHPISIAPEVKHPAHHNALFPGKRFEDRVLKILHKHGYALRTHHEPKCMAGKGLIQCGKLMVQSFDFESVKYLSSKVDLDVVELVMLNDGDPYFYTRAGVKDMAMYANWFSTWKEYLFLGPKAQLDSTHIKYPKDQIRKWGGFLSKRELVSFAHHHGLRIALYTFYDSREKSLRGCAIKCEPEDGRGEYRYFFEMGIDALFVENVNEAIQARTEFNTQLRKYNFD